MNKVHFTISLLRVNIEILMSMHTPLVPQALAPRLQGIVGAILQRLCQSKPVYVRPSKQLMEASTKVSPQVI